MGCLIFAISAFLVGALVGTCVSIKGFMKLLEKSKMETDKYLQLYHCMNEWVKRKQEKKNIASLLKELGYKSIAIYGVGIVGERLMNELEDSDIDIAYLIDKNPNKIFSTLEIVSPKDALKKVDAIIITPIYYFDEIEEMLSSKIDCPIVALDDLIYDL